MKHILIPMLLIGLLLAACGTPEPDFEATVRVRRRGHTGGDNCGHVHRAAWQHSCTSAPRGICEPVPRSPAAPDHGSRGPPGPEPARTAARRSLSRPGLWHLPGACHRPQRRPLPGRSLPRPEERVRAGAVLQRRRQPDPGAQHRGLLVPLRRRHAPAPRLAPDRVGAALGCRRSRRALLQRRDAPDGLRRARRGDRAWCTTLRETWTRIWSRCGPCTRAGPRWTAATGV